MPYPNQHAARIKDPSKFIQESFRSKILDKSKGISAVFGKLTGGDGDMVLQAYRFDKTKISSEEAKKWLKDNKIEYMTFEPSSDEQNSCYVRSIFAMDNIETREADGKRTISGYASTFGNRSVKFGNFYETVQRGAFSESLAKAQVSAIWNHNPDIVLGRQKNGTLKLAEDEKGLRFDLDLPDTAWARDAYTLIQRRDVDGMSFGFRIKKSSWRDEAGEKIRTLENVDLKEISPTAFPAYESTDVYTRAIVDDYNSHVLENIPELIEEKDTRSDFCRLYAYNLTL